jgi:hypothetical protein
VGFLLSAHPAAFPYLLWLLPLPGREAMEMLVILITSTGHIGSDPVSGLPSLPQSPRTSWCRDTEVTACLSDCNMAGPKPEPQTDHNY